MVTQSSLALSRKIVFFLLALSCVMLQNFRTYFKNFAVLKIFWLFFDIMRDRVEVPFSTYS